MNVPGYIFIPTDCLCSNQTTEPCLYQIAYSRESSSTRWNEGSSPLPPSPPRRNSKFDQSSSTNSVKQVLRSATKSCPTKGLHHSPRRPLSHANSLPPQRPCRRGSFGSGDSSKNTSSFDSSSLPPKRPLRRYSIDSETSMDEVYSVEMPTIPIAKAA